MNQLFLNSINITPQPIHTKIAVACEQCSHKCICAFQEDYLKTLTLIQNVLGDPQKDREIIYNDDGFTGYTFDDNSIFPQEIDVLATNGTEPIKGSFLSAKWVSIEKIKFLYKIEDYYVMFIIEWDKNFEKYIYSIGKELYYGIQYTLTEESANAIIEVLNTWKTEADENKNSELDVINTTPFSATLSCKYFKAGQTYRNLQSNTNHNCDVEGDYQHIATYHIENKQIKPAPMSNKPVNLAYPWFVPAPAPQCPPPKPKRRDDQ